MYFLQNLEFAEVPGQSFFSLRTETLIFSSAFLYVRVAAVVLVAIAELPVCSPCWLQSVTGVQGARIQACPRGSV